MFSKMVESMIVDGMEVSLELMGRGLSLDRAGRTQGGDIAGGQAELCQDRVGVGTKRGHRVHSRTVLVPASRRQQRRHLTGRRIHLPPAIACLQLRMFPYLVH